MRSRALCWWLVLAVMMLCLPAPARADGGLVLPDADLWAKIEEGQQIAVVTLADAESARVDLFVSMIDRSGDSREVTYFVPLGKRASDFQAVEQDGREFGALTNPLDDRLRDYTELWSSYKEDVRVELLLGLALTHGIGAALPPLLWLRGTAPLAGINQGITVVQTESSVIQIYDLDEQVDLSALIATTGLDPSVRDTLASLKGQQVAVVTLQTKPAQMQAGVQGYQFSEQAGLHLSWMAELAGSGPEKHYTYPLGTGRAWPSPIKLTRVYVSAPPGVDFEVAYPRLGDDLSGGYASWYTYGLAGRIDANTNPAYDIDTAYDAQGIVWRATYIQSNAAEDITITRRAALSPETRTLARQAAAARLAAGWSWLPALLLGAAAWLAAWRLVMPFLLRIPYRWRERRLYRDAFRWAGVYLLVSGALLLLTILAANLLSRLSGALLDDLLSSLSYQVRENAFTILLVLGLLPLLAALLGLVNAWLFARSRARPAGASRRRAFGAYLLTILAANELYLVAAFVYAGLVGAW